MIFPSVVNLVTPEAGAKHNHLFYEPATTTSNLMNPLIYLAGSRPWDLTKDPTVWLNGARLPRIQSYCEIGSHSLTNLEPTIFYAFVNFRTNLNLFLLAFDKILWHYTDQSF